MRFIKFICLFIMASMSTIYATTTAIQVESAISGYHKNDGTLNANGTIEFFTSDSYSGYKDVYYDANKSAVISQPITLNDSGIPVDGSGASIVIYGDGVYWVKLKDSLGNVINTYQSLQYTGKIDFGGLYVDIASSYGRSNTSLTNAITAYTGTGNVTFLFNSGQFVNTSSRTIPSNIKLLFVNGANLLNSGNLVYSGQIVLEKNCYITNSSVLTVSGNISFENAAYINNSGSLILNDAFISSSPQYIFKGSGTVTGSINSKDGIFTEWFGAIADESTDCTVPFQTAVNLLSFDPAFSSNIGSNLKIRFLNGSYKITDTIVIPSWINLEGSKGSRTVRNRTTDISWYGNYSKNMIEVSDIAGNAGAQEFTNLCFKNGVGHSTLYRPLSNIVFKCRVDQGTRIFNVWLQDANAYGIAFQKGGINCHLKNFRADSIGGYAIFWKILGSDSASFDGFTVDNRRSDLTYSGGAFCFDGTSATNGCNITAMIANAKLENNSPLAPTNSMIMIVTSPNISNKNMVQLNINSVWNVQDAAVSSPNYKGLMVSPASDHVTIVMQTSKLSIYGIPSYITNSGSETWHSFTVINPQRNIIVASPTTRTSPPEFCSDLFGIDYYQNNKFILNTIDGTTATSNWASPGTFQLGQRLTDKSISTWTKRSIYECTYEGTFGYLNGGITADYPGSGNYVTCHGDISMIPIGSYLNLNGNRRKVTYVNNYTNVIEISQTISGSFTGVSVSYYLPTFREIVLQDNVASTPNESGVTYVTGNIAYASNASTGNYVGWVCVGSGTSGTLSGVVGAINASETTMIVNSSSNLRVGDFISIAGVSDVKRIIYVSGTTIILNSASNASVTGASISRVAPNFKKFGLIESSLNNKSSQNLDATFYLQASTMATLNINLVKTTSDSKSFAAEILLALNGNNREIQRYLLSGYLDLPSTIKLSVINHVGGNYYMALKYLGVDTPNMTLKLRIINNDSFTSYGVMSFKFLNYNNTNLIDYIYHETPITIVGSTTPDSIYFGTTANRPTLTANDIGFLYYDTTLGFPIWWGGSSWADATGTPR